LAKNRQNWRTALNQYWNFYLNDGDYLFPVNIVCYVFIVIKNTYCYYRCINNNNIFPINNNKIYYLIINTNVLLGSKNLVTPSRN